MRTFCITIIIIVFASCEKVLFEKDHASSDPLENFEYLWNEVDKKYSYFELKKIDWDQIKAEFEKRARHYMTEEQLFDLLAEMLNELRDDHVNLISPFNVSRYNLRLQHPQNYHQRTVEEFYVPNGRRTGAFIHDFLMNDEIGYIRYASFMDAVDNDALGHILNRYQNTKGLILDLRANGGGDLFNIPVILEKFAQERILAAYSKTRNGPGRNDFGPQEPFYINRNEASNYSNPVMVLIDRYSYSATSFFAMLTKAFPNIKLIGDTTGGGGGLPNGGQLPNGWTYRFSVSQLLDLNGNNYAENGVPPDIPAQFDWSDLTTDEIIERAIIEILLK